MLVVCITKLGLELLLLLSVSSADQRDISQLCNYKSIFPDLLPLRAVPIPGDRSSPEGRRRGREFEMFLLYFVP